MYFYHGNIGESFGTIHAAGFTTSSSRRLKKEIVPVSEHERKVWLERVGDMKPVRYLFKDESVEPTRNATGRTVKVPHLGFLAEELPAEVLDPNGEGVDLYALSTAGICALQDLRKQHEEQRKVLELLQSRIEELERRTEYASQ